MNRGQDADRAAPQTERLVKFALERAASPSSELRNAVARSLFDFTGCVVGAATNPLRASADLAGRLAMRAHARDQDDLHLRSVTHPGGVIWSAITACAVERGATWAETVEAAIAGYEIVVRLSESLGPEHRRYWHPTPLAGVVGAATACARLLGGSDACVIDAAGHATSIASGSAQAQVEHTGTLLVHRAYAASMGLTCAYAALAGIRGNRWGLEQHRGVFATALPVILERRLGELAQTALEETGFRLRPASGFAHSAIDAALRVRRVPPESVRRIVVTVSPPIALDLASNPAPTSDEEAWWSIEHAVATCLVTGTSEILAEGMSRDARVLRLARLTSVRAAEAGWAATVEVVTEDGSHLRGEQDIPQGHGHRRASDDELRRKWKRLTGSDGSSLLARLLSARPTETFPAIVEDGLSRDCRLLWRHAIERSAASPDAVY